MFESGMGYRKVARLLGVSVYTVKDWSEQFKLGSFRVELPAHIVGYSDEFKDKAVMMHASGMSAYRISHMLGISNSTCLRWLREHQPRK